MATISLFFMILRLQLRPHQLYLCSIFCEVKDLGSTLIQNLNHEHLVAQQASLSVVPTATKIVSPWNLACIVICPF